MIDTIAYTILSFSVLLMTALLGRYFYISYKHSQLLEYIFSIEDEFVLDTKESKKQIEFKLKLVQSGISKKQFNEIRIAALISGSSLLVLIYALDLDMFTNIIIFGLALAIAAFMPYLYLEEQVKARIKRIDNDLAIFIDLLIIILEGGGGLNNAIDKVTTEGASVMGKDLLAESMKFKNEFITYGSEIAYSNLATRTGSEAVATIVGFMRLSEETGIGVKSIFENQAKDIKSAEILNIEKRAATMNISLTLTMFIFIIPSVIAMIAFPMAADALMPKF